MAKKKDIKVTISNEADLEESSVQETYIEEDTVKETSVEEVITEKVIVSPFPMLKCWKCGNQTPISFVCKFCGDKNPHRDGEKGK